MVDVTHDGHDWRTRYEVFSAVLFDFNGLLYFCRNEVYTIAEFFGDDADGFLVQALVDGHHHAQGHASGNDFIDGDIHHGRQF